MKIQYVLTLIICMAALLAVSARPANASEILYDGSGFMRGQQSMEQTFVVSGPGTLTVTLSNVDWPQSLASLNLLVSSTQGLLGPEMGAGTATFNVTGGDVFAQWFGTAQGPLNTGVYGLEVVWNSATATAPVPLPTSFALLLAGLLLLFWHRRGRTASGEMLPAMD